MKKLLLVALAAAAVALTASTTIASGSGATSASPSCDFSALFDPISVVTGGHASVARGPFKEPVLKAGPSNSDTPHGNNQDPSPTFQATIPVYVHVITGNGGVGNVPDAQIAQQIVELNRGFAGFYDVVNDAAADPGKTVTGFSFAHAGTTRTQNNAWWLAEPGTPEEFAMKGALRQGDGTALNLYITSGAGDQFLGWAYFPKILVYKKAAILDGVVVHYGSLPGGFIPSFNLGFTAVHEAGHWLGLYHTFAPEPFGCRADGDRIDDTPAMQVPTSGCPVGKDTCPEPGVDPVHNFMDYSVDPCYTEFSTGQAARMQAHFSHWRLKKGT
jgi:hypothetical protein